VEARPLVVPALDRAALASRLRLAHLAAEFADLLHRRVEVVDLEDDLRVRGGVRRSRDAAVRRDVGDLGALGMVARSELPAEEFAVEALRRLAVRDRDPEVEEGRRPSR
jgi:hypothetical protein